MKGESEAWGEPEPRGLRGCVFLCLMVFVVCSGFYVKGCLYDAGHQTPMEEIKVGMTSKELIRLAGDPFRKDGDDEETWVYNGYGVHLKAGRVENTDAW